MGLITILIIHWIADFVFQSHEMASTKSDNFTSLLKHTGTYSGVFFFGLLIISAFLNNVDLFFLIKFTFITFIAHTITDYYTSKAHKELWAKKDYHNFFVSIGFDQLLHFIQLFVTINLI